MVWLVTKVGVYDQGVYFVGETEDDALQFTVEYNADRDGYHSWRIDKMELGVPVEDDEWVPEKNRVHKKEVTDG